jgi:hypothetical protein
MASIRSIKPAIAQVGSSVTDKPESKYAYARDPSLLSKWKEVCWIVHGDSLGAVGRSMAKSWAWAS